MSEFLAATANLKTDDGCRRVVRHGHLPERQIMTGIGPVAVRQPRVRDQEAGIELGCGETVAAKRLRERPARGRDRELRIERGRHRHYSEPCSASNAA